MSQTPPAEEDDARPQSKRTGTPESKGGKGGMGGMGGNENGNGGGGGGSGSGGSGGSEADRISQRKGMLRIVADGVANGILIMVVTQGFSRLYFEQPRAILVGMTIAMICCIVMLLGMKSIARFIIFHRLILRSMKENPARSAFISKWLEEIVMHGITLFITLLLLALSRLVV